MTTVTFLNNEFHTEHEAICSALFNKYRWKWERPKHPMGGWLPDLVLRGDTTVWVECKGGLKWEDVRKFPELQRYEDAVNETSDEVLLIPQSPRIIKKANGFPANILGFLYDGTMWSHAEISRWSGRVGFCHSGNNWKDRMSGEQIKGRMGDGQSPDVELDWRSATQIVRGKRVAFFKGFADAEIEEWGASS